MRMLVLSVVFASLASCAMLTSAPTRDASAEDGSAGDANSTDATSRHDAVSVADAISRCNPSYPAPVVRALCDSQLASLTCLQWAEQGYPPRPPTPGVYGTCSGGTAGMNGAFGRCWAANDCASRFDPSTCRCGDGPACADDESCIYVAERQRRECQCRPAPAR